MKIRGQLVSTIADRLSRNSIACASGCIEWTGSKRNGYGRLISGSRASGTRRSISAHRAAYECFVGPIPDNMYVCHTCDNRACIHPEHLFVGTHQDNVDDRERKGRNTEGLRKACAARWVRRLPEPPK